MTEPLSTTAALDDLRAAVPEEHLATFEAELRVVLLCDLGTWAVRWASAVNSGYLPPRPYR